MSKADKGKGAYKKFHVERTDGRSEEGEKHHDCEYHVLDLNHDPFALPALIAYRDACMQEYPLLAADLTTVVMRMRVEIAREKEERSTWS